MKNESRLVLVVELGRVDYSVSLEIQEKLVAARIKGSIPDILLLLEHPPTYTTGRLGHPKNLLVSEEELAREGLRLFRINRGGDITFHGPGQLVGYPILNLRDYGQDIHLYLRTLEKLLIETLKGWDIVGYQVPGLTGVWAGGKKIASIGVGVKRWVSFHGFALNVNTDLSYFQKINPCGLNAQEITSMAQITQQKITLEEVIQRIILSFEELLGLNCQRITPEILWELIGYDQKAGVAPSKVA